MLLGRPFAPRIETVNDKDVYLANFWRALQADPHGVAFYADWPVNETDIHARHRYLVTRCEKKIRKIKSNPHYYDIEMAGWWVHGLCAWIGSGWCQRPDDAGNVMWSGSLSGNRRWQGGGAGGGSGVHSPSLQKPDLSGDSGASGTGIHASGRTEGIYEWFEALRARMRRVRVCQGDWRRVLTPSVTTYMGTTAVFLDPPYTHSLRERCYSEDHDISHDVREWAIANGDNPDFRIAYCGYLEEGENVFPDSWDCVAWKAHGGYARTKRGKENRDKERIWFSPHCLHPNGGPLFEGLD